MAPADSAARIPTSNGQLTAQDAAIFKAQERETSPVCQIKDFLYPELRQFLSQSFSHRLSQPVAAGMGVDQYHDVIRKTCVLKVLTIQPRKCRSEAIMARMLSELPEFSFLPSHSFRGCTPFWRGTTSSACTRGLYTTTPCATCTNSDHYGCFSELFRQNL
jgi:hypothetical protein